MTRLCLLPKVLSEMYSLCYAQVLDDFMKSENVEF